MRKTSGQIGNRVRLATPLAFIAVVAYVLGARWGERRPIQAEAVAGQKAVPNGLNLTEEETRTIGIYRQAAPSVANIITQAVEYDFFEDVCPSKVPVRVSSLILEVTS